MIELRKVIRRKVEGGLVVELLPADPRFNLPARVRVRPRGAWRTGDGAVEIGLSHLHTKLQRERAGLPRPGARLKR